MTEREWSVTPWRVGLTLRVHQVVFSDWAGTGYRYARNRRGRVLKFWTRKAAESHAAQLNREANADD